MGRVLEFWSQLECGLSLSALAVVRTFKDQLVGDSLEVNKFNGTGTIVSGLIRGEVITPYTPRQFLTRTDISGLAVVRYQLFSDTPVRIEDLPMKVPDLDYIVQGSTPEPPVFGCAWRNNHRYRSQLANLLLYLNGNP
ncbi:hypothetical protein HY025_01955 [Candidatus Daviesbacteria bacterium]|nr:hypothetical protein [Candidatus Daviesbacteria bacterium]